MIVEVASFKSRLSDVPETDEDRRKGMMPKEFLPDKDSWAYG